MEPVLSRALGICAAHGTLAGNQRHMFDLILDQEVEELGIVSQFAPVYVNGSPNVNLGSTMTETTARLQALTMYQIIRQFSNRARDFGKAATQEALFTSWTRELQLQLQLMRNITPLDGYAVSVGPSPTMVDEDVIDSAYRAVLMSYMVRAVHSVLNYKTCAVWDDLLTLVIPASLSGRMEILYPDYANQWVGGLVPSLGPEDRRLANLIIAACKGVALVQPAAT
ncbi:hypothetical protein C8035_v008598 [Colletotrichum spinosum]|uniref:Uncharacterized protein n=1 Tax=Colletotrichum spinosum TaxID=1347390 RepID=A0A4R8PQJ4_9PEZI|nr:hypothetical protein C8035_v008598 [Colletotrichum spinosum]